MKKAGISVIRIAEFAWSKVEPEEGVFTYDFFDEFLDLCSEKQMKVIFGTPTATPPAWLTEKYPEVLNARKMVCFSDMEEEDIIIITHRFIRDFVQGLWRGKLLIMRNIRQS